MSDSGFIFLTFYPLAMMIAGILAANIAPAKKRSGIWWGIFCFLFPPLLFVLLALRPGRNKGDKWGGEDDDLLDRIV